MPITWTPRQAAIGALLILAFPTSPLVHQAITADPSLKPLLDHLVERRIRWHFIDVSTDEVLAIAQAYDAAGQEHLAEMWLHSLSGETAELFHEFRPMVTEPDMRIVLDAANRPWTAKYLARWAAVRTELRALLDDPYIRSAAQPSRDRAEALGWNLDRPVKRPSPLALRLAGLDIAADTEEETAALNRRIAAAFPSLRSELRE